MLILNDDSYGMIRWKQANMGFEDWGLTYGNPDFVKYAESYGAHGHRVDSAAHLPELLASASTGGRSPDRLPGRLFGQRPHPQPRDQAALRCLVIDRRQAAGLDAVPGMHCLGSARATCRQFQLNCSTPCA